MTTSLLRLIPVAILLISILGIHGCDINVGSSSKVVTSSSVSGKFQAEKVEQLNRAAEATSIDVETRNGGIEVRQVEEAQDAARAGLKKMPHATCQSFA